MHAHEFIIQSIRTRVGAVCIFCTKMCAIGLENIARFFMKKLARASVNESHVTMHDQSFD